MSRLLTVPNWSFGRDRRLLQTFQDTILCDGHRLHFCDSDIDHNRTVSAFSGPPERVLKTLLTLCEEAFDVVDLNRHIGVHPRVGALDVCPFVVLENELSLSATDLQEMVDRFAEEIATTYDLPVFLYEKSERGRHEADLPSLRKGGFGGLFDQELNPDYGPVRAHPRLGVTVMGVRDFLIAMNVDFKHDDGSFAERTARKIRGLRREGDERFLGVRALGLYLASRELSQVSLNLTLPDLTPVDPIVELIIEEAGKAGVQFAETELIGVIRQRDMDTATHLTVNKSQIVDAVEEEAEVSDP
ncbi:MAG: hypothetical protein KF784_13560 [Fimbriimonadaceae bacterium]|nr:hypothetical protein [Fimbriimonadaceae bacterium]